VTQQDVQLVAGLAGLALVITLGDIIVSLVMHWRRAALARGIREEKGEPVTVGPAESGDDVLRQLLDIEAASRESSSRSGRGPD